jgi:hypothetical protein
MLVEWKRLLKENGVTQILIQDWSDDETAFRGSAAKPLPSISAKSSIWLTQTRSVPATLKPTILRIKTSPHLRWKCPYPV